MNFLKKIFGGGRDGRQGDAMYLYVKPKACDEILEVRIDMRNNLSLADDGDGYFMRKLARGVRCPFETEIIMHFDRDRRIINREINNGEFVTAEEYQQYRAQKSGQASG